MITIRNPKQCQSLTVIAGEDLVVGQCVKLVQAAVSGDPCAVVGPEITDYDDATLELGIVNFVPDDDEAVDFVVDPNDNTLTVNVDADNVTDIAEGAHCTFWFDKPIVGYTEDGITGEMDTVLTMAAREGTKIAFNTADHLLDTYDVADTDGSDEYRGVVYRNDGAELTIYFSKL